VRTPVSVTVHPSGAVEVNGVLVAEVHLGRLGEADVVASRDALTDELALHRIALVIHERMSEVLAHLERGAGQASPPATPTRKRAGDPGGKAAPTTYSERARFGEAMVAGLLGEVGELTGDQFYREGHWAGTTLRVVAGHLARAADEAGLLRPGATIPT